MSPQIQACLSVLFVLVPIGMAILWLCQRLDDWLGSIKYKAMYDQIENSPIACAILVVGRYAVMAGVLVGLVSRVNFGTLI